MNIDTIDYNKDISFPAGVFRRSLTLPLFTLGMAGFGLLAPLALSPAVRSAVLAEPFVMLWVTAAVAVGSRSIASVALGMISMLAIALSPSFYAAFEHGLYSIFGPRS